MSWPHRWVSSASNSFNIDFGLTTPDEERHGLSVFIRKGDELFRTYFSAQRGSEALGNVWGFLWMRRDAIRASRGMGEVTGSLAADGALSVVAAAR